MRMKAVGYWTTTGIVIFALLSGGIAELFHLFGTVDGVVQLGYPAYLVMILGTWKVLGAVAIAAPRFPRLKEWAYAGTFFDLTGAAVSQAVNGNGASHVFWPSVLAACAVVSWALRPPGRRLGDLLPSPDLHRPMRSALST
jgi:uncharacterized membrane protein YphA (DoxX/SURF4 family)